MHGCMCIKYANWMEHATKKEEIIIDDVAYVHVEINRIVEINFLCIYRI